MTTSPSEWAAVGSTWAWGTEHGWPSCASFAGEPAVFRLLGIVVKQMVAPTLVAAPRVAVSPAAAIVEPPEVLLPWG
jgi:hypothetical protein